MSVTVEPVRVEFTGPDGQPHSLAYFDDTHRYMLDGRGVPGASTIAKVQYQDVEALLKWSNRLGQEGKSHTDERDMTAEAGTAAHLQLESLANTGEMLDLDSQPERVRVPCKR